MVVWGFASCCNHSNSLCLLPVELMAEVERKRGHQQSLLTTCGCHRTTRAMEQVVERAMEQARKAMLLPVVMTLLLLL